MKNQSDIQRRLDDSTEKEIEKTDKKVVRAFDRLKHDFFDHRKAQTTIDYFLPLDDFLGDTTRHNTPSTTFISQSNMSPATSLKCDTTQAGTVVRNESDMVVATCNVVSVNQSPHMDIDLRVIKPTYPYNHNFVSKPYIPTYNSINSLIYSPINIDIEIDRRVVRLTIENPRQLRGLAILSSGKDAIKRIDDKHYQVRSQHGDFYYDVNYKYGVGWVCSCPNFAEYKENCKHIFAIYFSRQLRLEIEKEVNTDNILKPSDKIVCPECGSENIVKFGQRHCKKGFNQRHMCNECKHTFVMNRELSRLKGSPEVVSAVMDLYFKGISLSKIKHHLKMIHKVNIGRTTLSDWIHKFSVLLNEYAKRHKPTEIGDLWNSDEMTTNIRKKGKKNNLEWIWNYVDSGSRYLLASKITKNREVKDAKLTMREAKEHAGKTPQGLITDGGRHYEGAVASELYTRKKRVIHFRTQSKRKYFLNQNIERLNGTFRERTKVMRGFDSEETAQEIIDGERFYYNNIRPHMSLNSMTPAQVVGLPYVPSDNNAWLTYLTVALDERQKINRDRTRNNN